jgi:metal-dependent hydrolase (beta-lactamase superfamily II)
MIKAGKDFSKIKGVFITHPHIDHVSGLFNLLVVMEERYYNTDFEILMPSSEMTLVLKDFMRVSGFAERSGGARFIIPTDGFSFDNGKVKADYYQNAHIKDVSFSILVQAENKKIMFSGDLSGNLVAKDFPKYPLENKVDIMVLELAHFDTQETLPYLERLKTDRLLFNHINRVEKFERVKELAQSKKYGYEIYAPFDGDEFMV